MSVEAAVVQLNKIKPNNFGFETMKIYMYNLNSNYRCSPGERFKQKVSSKLIGYLDHYLNKLSCRGTPGKSSRRLPVFSDHSPLTEKVIPLN